MFYNHLIKGTTAFL